MFYNLNTNRPDQHTLPPPNQAVEVEVARIYRRNGTNTFAFLVTFRAPEGPRTNMGELPDGKLESKETIHDVIRREVREELNVEPGAGVFFATASDHDPSREREQHVRVHGFTFEVTNRRITPCSLPLRSVRWIPVDRFAEYQRPPQAGSCSRASSPDLHGARLLISHPADSSGDCLEPNESQASW
jgi:8-oxo-dGTP pyrophosphatase MutT (NUDIX family)